MFTEKDIVERVFTGRFANGLYPFEVMRTDSKCSTKKYHTIISHASLLVSIETNKHKNIRFTIDIPGNLNFHVGQLSLMVGGGRRDGWQIKSTDT